MYRRVSFPLISNVLDITWVSPSAVVTLPAGALAKYCNEHICVYVCVCMSVCLSANMSPEPHGRSLPIFLCMLPMAVAQSSSSRVTKTQEKWTILGLSHSKLQNSKALAIFSAAVAAAFTAKGIIQSPITSCSRRDHSVYQASATVSVGDAA